MTNINLIDDDYVILNVISKWTWMTANAICKVLSLKPLKLDISSVHDVTESCRRLKREWYIENKSLSVYGDKHGERQVLTGWKKYMITNEWEKYLADVLKKRIL